MTRWERFKLKGPHWSIKRTDIIFIKYINSIISKTIGNKYLLELACLSDPVYTDGNYFNEKYLTLTGDKYLDGYFMSWRYFTEIKGEIRKVFTFPPIRKEDKNNFQILKKINSNESISIHVRRGDYFKVNFIVYGEDYFFRALDLLVKKLIKRKGIRRQDLKLFVFSDDLDWCRENLNFHPYEYFFVDWNRGENSYIDMQLMSYCKHNIITNSTFSWWGAYLNKNLKKIVISPKYFRPDLPITSDVVDPREGIII